MKVKAVCLVGFLGAFHPSFRCDLGSALQTPSKHTKSEFCPIEMRVFASGFTRAWQFRSLQRIAPYLVRYVRSLIEDGHVCFETPGLLSEPIKSTSFIIICVRGFVFKKDVKYEIRQRGRGGGAKGIHTFPFRNLSLNHMQLSQVAVFVATSSPKT